jgi:hypothetical protein
VQADNIARYYVLVRLDIPLHQQIVQVAHAAITAGARFGCPAYHHLVLCGVHEEIDLHRASEVLEGAMIEHVTFYEPDDGIGYTALCTAPVTNPAQRRLFRQYPLWQAP